MHSREVFAIIKCGFYNERRTDNCALSSGLNMLVKPQDISSIYYIECDQGNTSFQTVAIIRYFYYNIIGPQARHKVVTSCQYYSGERRKIWNQCLGQRS